MAKLSINVQLKKDSGASLGAQIPSGDHTTLSAAKAAVQAVIDSRKAAAVAEAQDYSDADAGFNS